MPKTRTVRISQLVEPLAELMYRHHAAICGGSDWPKWKDGPRAPGYEPRKAEWRSRAREWLAAAVVQPSRASTPETP